MTWVKDHAIEIIALLVSMASAITSIATGLGNAFRTEPLALHTWTVFLLVVGINAGWLIRGIITVIASSGLQFMNERHAVKYLENQPDAFKEIIRDALENDGVYYEQFLDSDMRILAETELSSFFNFVSAKDFQSVNALSIRSPYAENSPLAYIILRMSFSSTFSL